MFTSLALSASTILIPAALQDYCSTQPTEEPQSHTKISVKAHEFFSGRSHTLTKKVKPLCNLFYRSPATHRNLSSSDAQ